MSIIGMMLRKLISSASSLDLCDACDGSFDVQCEHQWSAPSLHPRAEQYAREQRLAAALAHGVHRLDHLLVGNLRAGGQDCAILVGKALFDLGQDLRQTLGVELIADPGQRWQITVVCTRPSGARRNPRNSTVPEVASV